MSENMVAMVSRTGRLLQRYNKDRRLVVGCIPYRFPRSTAGGGIDDLQVLLVTSQNCRSSMVFPKGGWELDESIQEAASRECLEEAGVLGHVQEELGKWNYKSKGRGVFHEGRMFPLLVTQQVIQWPEQDFRERLWMSVEEAREVCQYEWMKEALDLLVIRLKTQIQPEDTPLAK